MSDSPLNQKIQELLDTHAVVLFMKGTARFPLCGFSGFVVQTLNKFSVDFHDVDVLKDDALRQGIKEFTGWPTLPQLYIKGEFIGGADILRDLDASGELENLLKSKGILEA